jgi:hypothetical protein
MGFAKFCRGVSICIIILAFFGAFAVADKASTVITITEYKYIEDYVETETDNTKYAIALITTWVSVGILCLFIYGMGEAVEHLHSIKGKLYETAAKQDKILKLFEESKNAPSK